MSVSELVNSTVIHVQLDMKVNLMDLVYYLEEDYNKTKNKF